MVDLVLTKSGRAPWTGIRIAGWYGEVTDDPAVISQVQNTPGVLIFIYSLDLAWALDRRGAPAIITALAPGPPPPPVRGGRAIEED